MDTQPEVSGEYQRGRVDALIEALIDLKDSGLVGQTTWEAVRDWLRALAAEGGGQPDPLREQIEAIVYDFGYVRGDLVEGYARSQMVDKLLALLSGQAAEGRDPRITIETTGPGHHHQVEAGTVDHLLAAEGYALPPDDLLPPTHPRGQRRLGQAVEGLCVCCELPPGQCGKAAEDEARLAANAARSTALNTVPGARVANFGSRCPGCGTPIGVGDVIRPIRAGDILLGELQDDRARGYLGVLCCDGGVNR